MCLLTRCVPLEYLSCSVARYTTMSNQGLHLCWQKTKRVPYLVRSARFISPLSVGIDRKSERILLCAPPWENVLYVSPCFRMERGHYRVDRASCTLWCETICSSGKKTAFERGSYVSDMLQQRAHLFHKDRPANIIWYQEVAFVFAWATGRKIPSLCRDRGDV